MLIRRNPDAILLLLSLAFVLVATGYPLAILFAQSLFPDLLGGSLEGFMSAWMRVFETPDLVVMLRNTLAWGLAVTVVAWIFGVPCGYWLARTNMPGKLWARLSLLAPIMTPPYIAALAYILVMQDGGFAERLIQATPAGLRQWFFSFWGVTLVMALSSFGYVALAVEATVGRIPARLEQAAELAGARRWQTLWFVVVPLLVPAIFNSGLLVFLEALSNFGVPAVLGTRANLPLLPAEIFFLVTSWPIDLALATSLSSLLCLFALVALYGARWLTARRESGGLRGGTTQLRQLSRLGMFGVWAWFGGLFVLSTAIPYAAMILTSLAESWGGRWPETGLAHYRDLFTRGSRGFEALMTSLGLSLGAATACVVIGGLMACGIYYGRGPLRRVVEGLATLPRVVPKIVLAVGLILAWNAPWIGGAGIYNTVWMLLLAYVVIYITDALNYADAGLKTLNRNQERAAEVVGASRPSILLNIVLPHLWPALLAAWVTTFIVCMRELVASILLLPPATDTTATFIFNQFEQGDVSAAMAMATVTIGLSTIVLILFQLYGTRRTGGRGG